MIFSLYKISLAALLVSAPAYALMPFARPPCRESGYAHSMGDLIVKVSIIGKKDDRGLITKLGPKLGMTKDEIKQARMSTGFIICPGTTPAGGTCSGSLIGTNDQIVTAAHCFFDDSGKAKDPLSKCIFQTQYPPYEEIPLDLEDGGRNLKAGRDFTGAKTSSDYAIAKLTKPVAGAHPFPVDLSNTPLKLGDQTIVVSAVQTGMRNPSPFEPAVMPCEVKDTESGSNTVIFGDCDLKGGSSGAIELVRSKSGQLVIRALATGGGAISPGKEYPDGESYSKTGSHSYSMGVDGEFLAHVLNSNPKIKDGHGAVADGSSP